jgi:hypothetical protein
MGTDEMKFITILCTRSATHLMRGTGQKWDTQGCVAALATWPLPLCGRSDV